MFSSFVPVYLSSFVLTGGMYDSAPHGAICATLLPVVFRKNAEKLTAQAEKGDASAKQRLTRFSDVARIVTGLEHATVAQGVIWLETLNRDLSVPPLSQLCPIQVRIHPINTLTDTPYQHTLLTHPINTPY